MPQLDKFSFATQLFWFCFIFLSYYILVLNFYLPKLFKILRFRNFKLTTFSIGIKKYLNEEKLITISYKNLIIEKLLLNLNYLNIFNKKYNNFIELLRKI